MPKTVTPISDSLYQYIVDECFREPTILAELREETARLENSAMQISPDQGQFMAFLTALIGAKNILEIGTFTGYSALAMAMRLPDDGKIVCCDVSKDWTNIAQLYWQRAEVAHKIDLKIAPALDTLKQLLLTQQQSFDFAFIDADKANYDSYFEACYQLVRANGIIAIDNMFWGGWVADPSQQDDDTRAIRALNTKLKNDSRVDVSIVPIGDGLSLVRKK